MNDAYLRHKDRAGRRQREIGQSGRDIGSIPPVADPERRAAAERCFRTFCETYLSEVFCREWSADHLSVIEKLESAVLHAGQAAVAMPRGSGKSSLSIAAVVWAALCGHHLFLVLIAANADLAEELLATVKGHLSQNDLLLEDFPEVLFPIHALENEPRRAVGQLHHGRQTLSEWGSDRIVLPTIPGSRASGVVIAAKGLMAGVRGLQKRTAEGAVIRPTLALLDDPQDDRSAKSPAMTRSRLNTIKGAVNGLAGPGQKTAMLVACTVIEPDDLAEQLLDPEKNPAFRGSRTQLVNRWPDDPQELWDRYLQLRAESLKKGGDGEDATAFYAANRAEMDAGADVAWPARFDSETELSALQHAYNLKLRFGHRFDPEFQNQPVAAVERGGATLDANDMADRATAAPRGEVPVDTEKLTGFIDVQGNILWWMLVAWRDGFGGHIVDYGAWPDQRRAAFTKADARRSYAALMPDASRPAQIYHALQGCSEMILAEPWPMAGGGGRRVDSLLIDEGWAPSQDSIYRLAAESKLGALIKPAKGVGLKARSEPMPDRTPKKGQRIGHHWMLTRAPGRALPHVITDTNRWKTIVAEGLTAPMGGPSAITVCDGDHRMLTEHLTAENATPEEANGRRLDIWEQIPGRDNDLFDCLVGCGVAASVCGLAAINEAVRGPEPTRRRRRYRASI